MLAHLVLSTFLQDPMVWVLCNLFCTIRRITNQDRSLAVAFLTFAKHLDISKPFGPASSIRPLGWQVTPDGTVTISPLLNFNCLGDSAKFIRSQISLGWNNYAIAQCAHRRDIQDQFLDIPTTRSIFSRLDESQKKPSSWIWSVDFKMNFPKQNGHVMQIKNACYVVRRIILITGCCIVPSLK